MKALPDKALTYGIRFMSANYLSELVDALVNFTDRFKEHDDDALVRIIMHNTMINPVDVVALAIHVNTQGIHNSTGFDKLNQIPPLQPNESQSVSLAAAAEGSQVAPGTWNGQVTILFKNDQIILAHAVELNNQFVQELNVAVGADNYESIVFFQPLPAFFKDISDRSGENMLGLDSQEHNAIIWTGHVAVKTNQQALAIAQTRMAAMAAELKSFAGSFSGGNRLVFMNYANPGQDLLGSYGEKSVEHIRSVAAKYDPKGVFQTRVPGGFKISRVACTK